MWVLTNRTLSRYCQNYPNEAAGLRTWMVLMENASFSSFSQMREVFGTKIDRVNHCYVFDVGGNNLRLVVKIHRFKVFIKGLYTHAQYDKGTWYGECNCSEK